MNKFFLIPVLALGFALIFSLAVSLAVSGQETPTSTTGILPEVELDEAVDASDLGIQEPSLLPDSPFYFLKNWQRGVKTFFTFNPVKKAELKLRFASEKLLEARKMAEKSKKAGAIRKAVQNYEEEVDRIREKVEKIKEKASQNEQVGKFLDKFVKQQALHQKILEKLEEQVPEEVFEKIKEARERHLERFSQVMEKLEDKEKISQRLEKNLQELRGSRFKNFKNLQILKKLEEKAPEEIKGEIQRTREKLLDNLKEKLEQLPENQQERFRKYIEDIRGEPEKRMELLEDIRSKLGEKEDLNEKLEETRERMIENFGKGIGGTKSGLRCAQLTPPAPGFCKNGRVIIERDPDGCPLPPRCVVPGEKTILPPVTIQPPSNIKPIPFPGKVCITLWDPVCGIDGKTYSNECFAKVAGVEVAHEGICKESGTSLRERIERKTEGIEEKVRNRFRAPGETED